MSDDLDRYSNEYRSLKDTMDNKLEPTKNNYATIINGNSMYRLYSDGTLYDASKNKYVNVMFKKHGDSPYFMIGKKSVKCYLLIYKTFIGKHELGEKVIYKDGNIENIRSDNLIKLTVDNIFDYLHLFLNEKKVKLQWRKLYNDPYNKYIISEYGDIFNFHECIMMRPRKEIYMNISLSRNKSSKKYRPHRLVYEAFNQQSIPSNMVVDHIDENKYNNHYSNLRLLTPSENALNVSNRCVTQNSSIIINQFLKDDTFLFQYNNLDEIVAKYDENGLINIINCCDNISESYDGFVWKYNSCIPNLNGFTNMFYDGNIIDNYKINKFGFVVSTMNNKLNILKVYKDREYWSVSIGSQYYLIHIAVASTFLCDMKSTSHNIVNHIDENKYNNYFKNLEWCTTARNVTHSCGAKTKVTNVDTDEVFYFPSIASAARHFNHCETKASRRMKYNLQNVDKPRLINKKYLYQNMTENEITDYNKEYYNNNINHDMYYIDDDTETSLKVINTVNFKVEQTNDYNYLVTDVVANANSKKIFGTHVVTKDKIYFTSVANLAKIFDKNKKLSDFSTKIRDRIKFCDHIWDYDNDYNPANYGEINDLRIEDFANKYADKAKVSGTRAIIETDIRTKKSYLHCSLKECAEKHFTTPRIINSKIIDRTNYNDNYTFRNATNDDYFDNNIIRFDDTNVICIKYDNVEKLFLTKYDAYNFLINEGCKIDSPERITHILSNYRVSKSVGKYNLSRKILPVTNEAKSSLRQMNITDLFLRHSPSLSC